jgi:undecaprenyl-diphosphatase
VTIGYEYLFTGLILWFAEKVKNQGCKEVEDISYKDAILIGTLQGVAILPAVSRSGLTIAGSLYRGIRRDVAARYSFLLSLPAILGAVVLQAKDLMHPVEGMTAVGTGPLIAGIVAAAVFGFIAVKWMISVLNRGSLKPFAYYVWALGIIILIIQWSGAW